MVNEIARLAQVYALEAVYALGSRAREVLALFILRRAGDLLPLERERLALIMEDGACPPGPLSTESWLIGSRLQLKFHTGS